MESQNWWRHAALSDMQLAIIDKQTERRIAPVEKLLRKFEIWKGGKHAAKNDGDDEEERNAEEVEEKMRFMFPCLEEEEEKETATDEREHLDEVIDADRKRSKRMKKGHHTGNANGEKDAEDMDENEQDPWERIPPYFRYVPFQDEKLGQHFNDAFKREFQKGGAPTNEYMVELDEKLFRQSTSVLRNSDRFLEKHSVLNDLQGRALAPNINKKYEKTYNDLMQRPTGKTDERLVHSDDEDEDSSQSSSTARPNLGKKWFHMEAPHMTPGLKQDLMAIKLLHTARGGQQSLNDESDLSEQNLPKYFQIGTMVEGATEYFSDRSRKRDRKKSILDQIIHDQTNGSNYISDRYKDIQDNLDSVQKRKKRRIERSVGKRMK